MNKLLRATRITVQVLVAALLTAALIDYCTGTLAIARWLAHIQIVPAALALSAGVLLAWLAVTVVCGRIYCSTACPMARFRIWRPVSVVSAVDVLPVFPALQPHEAYIARCVCGLAHSRCVGTGVADRSL